MQAREQGRNPSVPRLLSEHDATPAGPSGYEDLQEYADYDRYFNDFDEDEQASLPACSRHEVAANCNSTGIDLPDVQVEAYYRSSAAGPARITLGNRRWGENGYVSAGRMRARPVQPVPSKVWGSMVAMMASASAQRISTRHNLAC